MSRIAFRTLQVLLDLLVLSAAYWLAFLARFEGGLNLELYKLLFFTWPYVIVFQYVVLSLYGIPWFAWRYIGIREASRILVAVATSVGTLAAIRLGFATAGGYSQYVMIPLGVLAIDFVVAFLGISGLRVLRRAYAERTDRSHTPRPAAEPTPTLLVGAGRAGVAVAQEIARRPDIGMRAVGFVDDDQMKVGTVIHGLTVLGTTSRLAPIARRRGATQALITIASGRGKDIRRITELCSEAGLAVKIIPAVHEILDGSVNLSMIREVSIEDLLGREPVKLEEELVARLIADKRVLVTGAGGSIGSELCRQIARLNPRALTLGERAEYQLFTIHEELRTRYPQLHLVPRMCDVCDSKRLDAVFAADQPQIVFHAAAHKHVPMMELNPGEALKNNVFGTKKVADAADRHGTGVFVLISTDKAVNSSSIMGATKRVAEMYTQALSSRSKTKYVAVRFGNVLGSAGSVIPTFKAQIAQGGPVTVTHPDMKRYFMTIPEACQLVMQAAAMGDGGEIFVLDMGEPVRIIDLATEMIRLSGFEPGEDIQIELTGLRPGEKLFEEIGFDAEKMSRTRHPKIYIGKLAPCAADVIERRLAGLAEVTGEMSTEAVRAALCAVVPEMEPADVPARQSTDVHVEPLHAG
jgi:FlaA1/EpsC-like NDP-sugar epimerase